MSRDPKLLDGHGRATQWSHFFLEEDAMWVLESEKCWGYDGKLAWISSTFRSGGNRESNLTIARDQAMAFATAGEATDWKVRNQIRSEFEVVHVVRKSDLPKGEQESNAFLVAEKFLVTENARLRATTERIPCDHEPEIARLKRFTDAQRVQLIKLEHGISDWMEKCVSAENQLAVARRRVGELTLELERLRRTR